MHACMLQIFVSAIFTKIRLQIFGDLIPSHEAGNEHRVVSSGNFILIVIDMKDHH
jgi:hypothetical protein